MIVAALLLFAYLGWKYFPDIDWPASEPAKEAETQRSSPPIPDQTLSPQPGRAESFAGSSRAKGNLLTVFSSDDYPQAAMRNGEEGTVNTRLEIGTDGKVARCVIVQSSGSDTLDQTTCRIFQNRVQMQPAQDQDGNPTTDTVNQRVTWRLPED